VTGVGLLRLAWRPFHFRLPRAMVSAHGTLEQRRGWLLRLEDGEGRLGWGEAAPIAWQQSGPDGGARPWATDCPWALAAAALAALPQRLARPELECRLPQLPAPLAFALGLALAEIDGLGAAAAGGWRPAPASAVLLPAGAAMPAALEAALDGRGAAAGTALTVKWKVAAGEDVLERQLLERLLDRLPAGARLRLDANGGWDRATAAAWAERLAGNPRLEWLEQPLDPADGAGLEALAARLPLALDESLRLDPALASRWRGWQVRRPAQEGDPRPLLAALAAGTPRLMLSTALETGIAWRLLGHLAALQQDGPTPTAPGLAPGWRPAGGLFAADPARVWQAALEEAL
jgi:O-succinylbenzoate synthase